MRRINKVKLLFISGLFSVLFLIFSNSNTLALNGEINNLGPATGSSSSTSTRSWYAVGRGGCPPGACADGFHGLSSLIEVYSTSSTMKIELVSAGGGCGSEDNKISAQTTRYTFYNGSLPNVNKTYTNDSSDCLASVAGGSIFNVSTDAKYPAGTYNGKTLWRIILVVTLNDTTAFLENSFRVNVNRGLASSAETFVSITDDQGSFTGLYQKDSPIGSTWSQAIVFSAPCNAAAQDRRLLWFDADEPLYNDITMSLERRLRGSANSWTPQESWGASAIIGNSGDTGFRDVYIDPKFEYRWTWSGVAQINTIQVKIPFSQVEAKISCPNPTPPGYYCQITVRNITNGQVADSNSSAVFSVTQGDTVRPEVFSHNGSGTVWERPYRVYFTQDIPGSTVPGGLGRVHKYGTNVDRETDFGNSNTYTNYGLTPSAVGAGGNSSTQIRADISTVSVGSQAFTYSVNHLQGFDATGVAQWERLATCSITVMVNAPALDGDIQTIDCRDISFSLYWGNGATTPINVTFILTHPGGSNSITTPIAPGNNIIRGVFNDLFPTAPIYHPPGSYAVTMYLNGSVVPADTSNTFGGCVSLTCSNPPDPFEAGSSTPYVLTFTVINGTNRTNDTGYTVNTPGITIVRASNWVYNTSNYLPAVNSSVVGQLYFNGNPGGVFSSACNVVVARYPYVKAFGADVMAGGGFENFGTCSAASGIFARMRPINRQPIDDKSGSGSQLGAFGFGGSGDISGFGTATLRSTATAGNGLAFSGVGLNGSPGNNTGKIGGNLSGTAPCMPDYYNDTRFTAGDGIAENHAGSIIDQGLANANNNKQVFMNNGNPGDVEMVSIPNFSSRTTFYVNGDLFINNDVIYSNYSTLATIPNFTVVVLGDIYIDNNVSRLDGTYIAQPLSNGSKGRIYTCSNNTGRSGTAPTVDATAVYNTCSGGYTPGIGSGPTQRLTVNGSFIARKVVLNRAVNTLNDSRFKENSRLRSAPDNDPLGSAAAEVFNFSLEVYLSPPVFNPRGCLTCGDYDAVAILPPIL